MSLRRYAAKRDANERALVRELESLGFLVVRLDPKYGAGLPDLLVLKAGRTALVETKAEGGKLSEAQQEFIGAWLDAGGSALVARNTEDVLLYFGMIDS